MRRLLTACLLFSFLVVICSLASAQLPALLQMSTGGQTCAFPQNVVSGNTLIVAAHSESTVTGISDTRTSSFTLIDSNTSGGAFAYVWLASAGGSGADTVTITGTNSFTQMVCFEWPATLGTTVDAHANGSYSGTPATVTTSSLTTSTNGDFLISFMSGFQSGGHLIPTAPTQFLAGAGGNDSYGVGYRFTGTNGSYNAVFSNTANTKGGYVILALKPSAITIVTSSLPTAASTDSYSYTLQAVGGAGAYTWSVSSGALPAGISLNSSTGALTGTPTGGTSSPTFQVTDGTHTTTAVLTLSVHSSSNTIGFIQSSNSHVFDSNVTAGDVIVAGVDAQCCGNPMAVRPPTDTLGTSFKIISFAGVTGQLAVIYAGVAPSSGADTVTAAGNSVYIVAEFSNAQLPDTSSLSGGFNSGTVTLTSNSVTTLAPNSMLYALAEAISNSTLTANSPFTAAGTNTSFGTASGGYNAESSTGSYSVSFAQTGNAGAAWAIVLTAMRPSGTGTVGSNIVRHRSQVY